MKKNIVLICIILLAAVLRLWQLGNVPPSPDWDEAALGYNAYSIMHTGRDEYGAYMPIVLESFGDFKPALYTYFVIPFIAMFGLETFAVRLPSAIFGILTVLATYFLVRALFKRKDIALIAALLLAISPWHIQFSRVGFESNIGLAFNVFAALFFIKGLKKPWMLFLSAACMGLNFSVYQSDRVFTPLLAIVLVAIYWRELIVVSRKYLVGAVLVGLVALSPFLMYLATNDQALARAKGVSVFSKQTDALFLSNNKLQDDKEQHNLLGQILHNRRVVYAQQIIGGYLSHYDLNWLFITGDMPRHHAPGMGLLYLWELPFLLFGFYALLFFNFPKQTKWLLFAWFFLAPVPAAITNDVPHAVRTLNFLPTFQVFVAVGIVSAFAFVHDKKKLIKKQGLFVVWGAVLLIAGFNFFYYLNQYFAQQNYFVSQDWQYGYKEAVASVKAIEGNYDKIVVSNELPLDQSYIFFLYYQKYSPQEYQKSQHIEKYEFRPINWDKEKKDPKVLYVNRAMDVPQGSETIKTINYLDGTPAIRLIQW